MQVRKLEICIFSNTNNIEYTRFFFYYFCIVRVSKVLVKDYENFNTKNSNNITLVETKD